jgi:Dolichyl-phosphate-mannose-protein mannosyltransferase
VQSRSTAPARPLSARAKLVLGAACIWMVAAHVTNPMVGGAVHGDGYYTWLWTRSMVFDHDLDFEGDYGLCSDPWGLAHTEQGDFINQWNPGASLFWLPIVLVDLALHDPALDSPNPRYRAGCEGPIPERAVRGSLLAGALTMLLTFLVARRHYDESSALFGAVAVTLLSPLFYYATMLLSYAHAASACMGALVVWTWDREVRTPRGARGFLWMGIALGLAMLTRPQNAVLVILPLSLWIGRAWSALYGREWVRARRLVGHGLLFSAALAVCFAPQIWQWYWGYGELFFLPQGRHYLRWSSPRLAQMLFSVSNGLLPWNPVLYLAFAGLLRMCASRQTRYVGITLLCVVVSMTYVNASVYDWWGNMGYPGRRFDSTTAIFGWGLASFAEGVTRSAHAHRGAGLRALATGAIVLLALFTTGASEWVARAGRTDLPHRSDGDWKIVGESVSGPLWQAVGNPLTWPASIPFALHYGVPIRAWDFAGGPGLFFHHWLNLTRPRDQSVFRFGGEEAVLLGGFENEAQGGVRYLEGEFGRMVIPIAWPDVGALRFAVTRPADARTGAHLWVELDGEDLGTFRVSPGASTLEMPVYGRHEGICLIRLRASQRVGFRELEIVDPTPAPSVAEAEYLREVAARRRAFRAASRGTP